LWTLIEFKLTTLAGFVLVPFALWNKTAFLAERVLGNVISSGIKVLVLAVIVGIGTGIFGEFTAPNTGEMTIDKRARGDAGITCDAGTRNLWPRHCGRLGLGRAAAGRRCRRRAR